MPAALRRVTVTEPGVAHRFPWAGDDLCGDPGLLPGRRDQPVRPAAMLGALADRRRCAGSVTLRSWSSTTTPTATASPASRASSTLRADAAAEHQQVGVEHRAAVSRTTPRDPAVRRGPPAPRRPERTVHAEGADGAGEHARGAGVELAFHQPRAALDAGSPAGRARPGRGPSPGPARPRRAPPRCRRSRRAASMVSAIRERAEGDGARQQLPVVAEQPGDRRQHRAAAGREDEDVVGQRR